jgi:negative regulator of sigma E activity
MDNNIDLSQYYTIEDLDNIRITETDKTGQIRKMSLKEISSSQFEIWLDKRFMHLLHEDLVAHKGEVWNYHDRVNALNTMNVVLGRLCVEMER